MAATASSAGGNPWDIFCAISKALCGGATPPGAINTSGIMGSITTVHMESINRHAKALKLAAASDEQVNSLVRLHVTPQGGSLISAPVIGDGKITVPLSGSILGVPYSLTLIISLDLSDKQITVELDVEESIKFDHTWTFNINGFTPILGGAAGAAMASGIELAPPSNKDTSAAAKGVDFLCIIGCGGAALIPILLQCLPSLIGGSQAYLACLATQAGTAAAAIVQCIATKCFQ